MSHRLSIDTTGNKRLRFEPWMIRQAIYIVASAVGLAMVILGKADPQTVTANVDKITGLLSVLLIGGGGLAAVNTRPPQQPTLAEDHAADIAADAAAMAVDNAVDTIRETIRHSVDTSVAKLPEEIERRGNEMLDKLRAEVARRAR